MYASIAGIEFHLPESRLTTETLSTEFPEWSVASIDAKTGIRIRCIASKGECASDLGFAAARKLFESGKCLPVEIDFLLLCTQSPDYYLPSTSCLLQDRLGIPTTAGALDFNLGCSGFVFGLGLAEGLVQSGQANCVLLITAETYSKFLNPSDKVSRTIFGDAAAATLIRGSPQRELGPFVYGTDGTGGSSLIVPGGAMRARCPIGAQKDVPSNGRDEDSSSLYLQMNGAAIFDFALRVVPVLTANVLAKACVNKDDVDLFVYHQANKYMLEELRKVMGIPGEKMMISLEQCGNTVSSTIPICLKQACEDGRLRTGSLVLIAAFGVGYSWGATLIRWANSSI